MWINKSKRLLFMIVGILLIVSAVYLYYRHTHERVLRCHAMVLNAGYGYVITLGKDTLIYQPYIPAIGRKIPFSSRGDAMKAGKAMCHKLLRNQQPGLNRHEIDSLGIIYPKF